MLALKPKPVLVTFLVVWAPSLFILKDQELVTIGRQQLNLSRLLGGLLLIGLLLRVAYLFLVRRTKVQVGYASLPLVVFGLYLILCFSWSVNPETAGAELLRYWTGLLFFLVLRTEIQRHDDIEVYAHAFLAGITLAAALTLITWRLPESLGPSLVEITEGVVRASGTAGAAGATGALLFCGLPIFMSPPMKDSSRTRITLRLCALGIVCAALTATLTRAVLLSIPPFLFLWSRWVHPEKMSRKTTRVLFLFGVLVPTSLALLLQNDALIVRVADIPFVGTTLSDLTAGTGRLAVWQANLEAWRAADLSSKCFGLGLHSSSLLTIFAAGQDIEVGPHNTYLWLLVDTGLVGLGIYLAFVVIMTTFLLGRVRVLRTSREHERHYEFVAAFASFFVIYNLCEEMFMSQVVSFGGHAYFLAMLAFATSNAHQLDPTPVSDRVLSGPEGATAEIVLPSSSAEASCPS